MLSFSVRYLYWCSFACSWYSVRKKDEHVDIFFTEPHLAEVARLSPVSGRDMGSDQGGLLVLLCSLHSRGSFIM